MEPDAVSWAKGIANGFPLGAFWAGTRLAGPDSEGKERGSLCDLLGPGTHGTTFGGNPLASSVGLAVLSAIKEEGLLANSLEMGTYLKRTLERLELPLIRTVRGIGLMIGIELNDMSEAEGAPSLIITKKLMSAGLLVIPSGERTIRLLPPLNVSREEVDEALSVLRTVLTAS